MPATSRTARQVARKRKTPRRKKASPARRGLTPAETGEAIPESARALAADPFGNLVTSVREGDLGGAPVVAAHAGGRAARWVRTFGEGSAGELLALIGSGGRVEIAVREGSAAAALGAVRGLPVRLVLGRAGTAC